MEFNEIIKAIRTVPLDAAGDRVGPDSVCPDQPAGESTVAVDVQGPVSTGMKFRGKMIFIEADKDPARTAKIIKLFNDRIARGC